jgi:hypothetical protein
MAKKTVAKRRGTLKKGQQPKVPENRRCTSNVARSGGRRCPNAAIKGGTVCDAHGGRAPQTRAAAKRRIREYVADMVDPDRVLQEAARMAFSDIRQLYDDKGRLKSVNELPADVAAAVKSVENIRGNVDASDGAWNPVVKVTMTGKEKSLEMLFKHLGLLEEKVTHSGGITVKWEE